MVFGWFKRGRGNRAEPQPGDVPAVADTSLTTPASVPEVTPVSVPVAELEPGPVATLPTEPVTPPPRGLAGVPREKVAARAYEIWVRKGRPPGTEVQNWLDAEAELRAELAARPTAPPRKSR